MKKFWKVLGLGALIAGLTPYKVEKNEETGESSYQALLWRITSAPAEEEGKREIGINLGEGTLTSKLLSSAEKAEETHLFSDELCVEYTAPKTETEEEPAAAAEAGAAAEEAAAAEDMEAEEEKPADAGTQTSEEPAQP